MCDRLPGARSGRLPLESPLPAPAPPPRSRRMDDVVVAVRAEADERELSLERALELPRGEAGGVRLGEVRVKSVAPPAYVFGQNIFQCDVSKPPLTPHV